jgi:hypothetical protein
MEHKEYKTCVSHIYLALKRLVTLHLLYLFTFMKLSCCNYAISENIKQRYQHIKSINSEQDDPGMT